MEIREAIREERTIQMSLLNYRKNGTPFWMLFHLSPIFSKEDGRVIHFVSVQVPILRKLRNEDGIRWQEITFGSCRRELCSDSVMELARCRALDSFVDSDNRGLYFRVLVLVLVIITLLQLVIFYSLDCFCEFDTLIGDIDLFSRLLVRRIHLQIYLSLHSYLLNGIGLMLVMVLLLVFLIGLLLKFLIKIFTWFLCCFLGMFLYFLNWS